MTVELQGLVVVVVVVIVDFPPPLCNDRRIGVTHSSFCSSSLFVSIVPVQHGFWCRTIVRPVVSNVPNVSIVSVAVSKTIVLLFHVVVHIAVFVFGYLGQCSKVGVGNVLKRSA